MKNQYRLQPTDFLTSTRALPSGFELRNPSEEDVQLLADLMLNAYRNTIDFEDETIEDAVRVVQSYFEEGSPILDCSFVCWRSETPAGAILVSLREENPIIRYVMVRAAYKGRGLGGLLLLESVKAIFDRDYDVIDTFITEGNVPSETIFDNTGFLRVAK